MSVDSTQDKQRTPAAVNRLVRRFRSAASGLWYEKPEAAGSINAVELDGQILEREDGEHTMAWIRRVSAWAHEIHSANAQSSPMTARQDTLDLDQDAAGQSLGAAPCSALVCDETAPGKPYLVPMTLRKANDFVAEHHRHNGRTARNGGKWSAGVAVDGKLVGVAIVGNPLSATLMDGWTAEVLRVCTIEAAPKGTCSMLYQACWRAWRAMGGRRLITYTLQSESGASLRGANWRVVGQTKPVKDGWRKNDHLNANRTHSPVMLEVKNRWQTDDGSYSPNSQNIKQ